MANSIANQKRRKTSDYPDSARFNARENRQTTHNFSLAVTDSDLTLTDSDGISFVRNTGANAITLPTAKASRGRVISFLQVDAAVMTITQNADDANIDGADANFTALDAADDWAEFFCDGSEWLITKEAIA